jgi:cobalt transporter subunit CbtA
MARRIFLVGILAGLIAGSFVTLVQMAKVTPLILRAETYEAKAAAHEHGAATAQPAEETAWEPAEGLERRLYTWLANILVGIGFGLVLSAGFALRHAFAGEAIDARRGLCWGTAGFAAFALAPALGLPPEPPGTMAADLAARQAWWLGTALATLGGIGLLAFARYASAKVAGCLLLVVPHAIGAPPAPHAESLVPAELAAQFVASSLAAAALFWLVLGGVGGWLFQRLGAVGR